MATFGEHFQAILRSRGLTQTAAAKLLETTQSVISYYSNLEHPPRRGTLLNIAERLGTSVAELKGEKESAGVGKHGSSKTSTARIPSPDQSVCKALHELRRRWKTKPQERDTIRHLVAALFPADDAKVLSWLEQA